jgi:OPA family glycerol-3-phosphate transporter-like MFS transporter
MNVFYARRLDRYPVGRRRIWLLLMAVIASLVGSYEAQISPVLPLLLKGLGMSLATYGVIAGISVILGAVAAAASGPLADRWGRVTLLVPSLFLTGICWSTTPASCSCCAASFPSSRASRRRRPPV